MYRPNMFSGSSPQAYVPVTSSTITSMRPINISKLDSTRSRWDKPFQIPSILYKKLNVLPPEEPKINKPEGKSYPSQFLQFIERSYSKCSNQTETKHMEAELRKVMTLNEKKMHTVNWKDYEIPKIPKTQQLPKSISAPALVPMIIKANRTNNVSQSNGSNINPYNLPSHLQYHPQPQNHKIQSKFPVDKMAERVESLPKPKFPTSLIKGSPVNPPQKKFKSKQPQPDNLSYYPHIGKFSEAPIIPPKPVIAKNTGNTFSSNPLNKSQVKNKKLQQKLNPPLKPLVIIQQTNVAQRVERQSKFRLGPSVPVRQVVQQDVIQIDEEHKIVGTSQQLEKKYLRITTHAPDPSTVRPEHVLKKVLEFLRNKYKNGSPYQYISEQFRSLRQDLLVQHIRNSFTVEVYEENTKISLFSDDMSQYHQCQSALWDLYRNGIYKTQKEKNKYIGFQVLALIMDQKYRELQFMLLQLKPSEVSCQDVQTVLRVRQMLTMGNYRAFFQFYNSRDTLTRCLLNQYIDKIRASCIAMFSKTMGQKISVESFADIIADNSFLLEQMIVSIGGVVRDGYFYCKESSPAIQQCELLFKQKSRVTLTFN